MNFRFIIFLFICCLTFSCNKTEKTSAEATNTASNPVFKGPVIPDIITDPSLRVDYIMSHYWDYYNFNDTALLKTQMPEQAFVDFIHICSNIEEEKKSITGLNTLLEKLSSNKTTLHHFLKLGDKYLYDPNSPYRNDSWYLLFLKAAVNKGFKNEAEKMKYEKRLILCSKNNRGSKAENFKISYIDNISSNMYDVRSEYLILYFHNPECEDCKITGKKLAESPVVNSLISSGKLNILSVYTDEDLSIWEKHYDELPSNWINTYNNKAEVKNLEIYDLKAIPALYLLDKDKNVIIKDAKPEDLLFYLSNI
jgi:hypothetical protein